MKRRTISAVVAAFIFTAVLSGCTSTKTGTAASSSGTKPAASSAAKSAGTDDKNIAVMADTQCPTSLDLAQSWDSWYTSRWGIAETLFKLDQNLSPQPFLAKSCEKTDDTTWKIILRDDVTFQNGKKLTADSVKKCWERTEGINPRFKELMHIASTEADGQTLTVKTSKPVPAFENALCEPLTGIIDVSSGTDFAAAPVGTGPFIAVKYDVKSKAEVKRYDGYWGGKPKLSGAVINIISDTGAIAMAQQNGESNVSVNIPAASLQLFNDTSKYTVDGVSGSRGQVIYFNYSNELLQQKAIREAIGMCIDKENYAKVINKGASVPAGELYPDASAYGKAGGTKYDTEGAKKLLDEAGIKDTNGDGIREYNGKAVSLKIDTYSTRAELGSFCSALSAAAKQVGIEITPQVTESISQQEKSGDFDMLLLSIAMLPTGDPQYFADMAFKTGGTGNYGKYSNKEVDEAINELDNEFDQAKRTELAKKIQQLVTDDAGFIVIGHSKYYYVMSSDFKGLHTNPSEYYMLDSNVYMENQ